MRHIERPGFNQQPAGDAPRPRLLDQLFIQRGFRLRKAARCSAGLWRRLEAFSRPIDLSSSWKIRCGSFACATLTMFTALRLQAELDGIVVVDF
jgi:hypothetical protein